MCNFLNICADVNIPNLKECFDKGFSFVQFANSEKLRDLLLDSKCEALFCRSTIKVNEELLKDTKVKFVATATSGTDHFDKEYLKANNIAYFDALGSNSNAVAEYIIFSILHKYRNDFSALSGKKIGIVGFGNVGSKVAKYARRIGLEVLVNDPPLFDNGFIFPDYVEYCSLHSICETCDIITNHIPLEFAGEYQTYNLFSKKEIELIKPNALFLHASRGKTLQEDAMIKAVECKNISVIIDVWENEPLVNTLLSDNALIATPHIAGHSYEGKLRGSLMVAEAFERFTDLILDKSPILNELDKYKPAELEFYSDLNNIYESLKKSRLLLQDSEEFKISLYLSEIDRAQYFKNFRKNYPIRRETL